jgi:thiol-disulfide isomerase/thioredoxin
MYNMPRIQNVLYNSYIHPFRKTLFILLLVIIFLGVGIYLYRKYVDKTLASNASKNVANAVIRSSTGGATSANASKGTVDVYFFNVDWCPHCVKAKPIWTQFVQKYDGQSVNGYQISCIGGNEGVNCTNADDTNIKKLIKQYDIKGYPTIKFVQNGTTIDFDAKVTMDNLDSFMNTLQ